MPATQPVPAVPAVPAARRVPAVVVGVALLAGLLAACGQGTTPAAPAGGGPAAGAAAGSDPAAKAPAANAPAAPAKPATIPAAAAGAGTSGAVSPSALQTLAPFIAAARADDFRIRTAASALNNVATPTALTFNRATATTAAAAANPRSAAVLPAGLPPALKSATILVYSDLVARGAPFYYVSQMENGTVPRADESLRLLLDGLRKNAPFAARFPADLAALERLAARSAAVAPVRANSTAAAERAVLVAWVDLANHGCAGTGGYASGTLPRIFWGRKGSPQHWYDGSIGGDGNRTGIAFDADFRGGSWHVELNAC
ncbi:MAG TPA: hypothetical protein VMU51_33450 [Mycobacteriales bacterium]|nr:hypothetical protein [Mycobacteriales bacterium]